jgi:hypothetical protein
VTLVPTDLRDRCLRLTGGEVTWSQVGRHPPTKLVLSFDPKLLLRRDTRTGTEDPFQY